MADKNKPGKEGYWVELIASEPGVRKVVLFGSSATGQRTKDSDIDILVLVEGPEIDALEFSERSMFPTLERKIAREGKVLYAA